MTINNMTDKHTHYLAKLGNILYCEFQNNEIWHTTQNIQASISLEKLISPTSFPVMSPPSAPAV